MEVLGALLLRAAISDLIILLLKEAKESGAVVSTVTLGPETDAIVGGLIEGKLKEPSLGKMPQGMSCLLRAVGGVRIDLAAEGANVASKVGRRNTISKVSWSDLVSLSLKRSVEGAVGENIVGESDLVGLVQIKHVDFIIPTPGVQVC